MKRRVRLDADIMIAIMFHDNGREIGAEYIRAFEKSLEILEDGRNKMALDCAVRKETSSEELLKIENIFEMFKEDIQWLRGCITRIKAALDRRVG